MSTFQWNYCMCDAIHTRCQKVSLIRTLVLEWSNDLLQSVDWSVTFDLIRQTQSFMLHSHTHTYTTTEVMGCLSGMRWLPWYVLILFTGLIHTSHTRHRWGFSRLCLWGYFISRSDSLYEGGITALPILFTFFKHNYISFTHLYYIGPRLKL